MKGLCVLFTEATVLAFVFAQMAEAALTNRYVIKDNAGSAVPYDTTGNAASNIQIAIDYAYAGETVLVAAATYDTGGVTNWPAGTILTNRVAIWKAITVRSVDNDPTNTIIKGAGPIGAAAVRCVYMIDNSSLIGFTLTNGATATNGTDDTYGGGVYCPLITSPIISNCVIAGNLAKKFGGGTHYGTLYNCTIVSNSAESAGGAFAANMSNCTVFGNSASLYGGGLYYGNIYNCTIVGNTAGERSGGSYYGTLYNCTIVSNSSGTIGGGSAYSILYNCMIIENSTRFGGGSCYGTLYNCTVSGNTATDDGGGVNGVGLYNSIVYFNTSPNTTNWFGVAGTNNCTTPALAGVENITGNPMFVDTNTANYHLSPNSPCINTGTNYSWMTTPADVRSKDLDGRKRIQYGTVDMGAYERLNAGTIFTVR